MNLVQDNLTALSTTVTGLVNGTNYYWFGVRATDAANNVETANTTITTPGVTPTGGGGGVVCGDCHAIPPATGAHAEHADADADYTDCEACHGTVAGGYTTTPSGTHNNGSASFVAAITYSNNGTTANKNDDTCFTTICHNQSARSVGSATWTTGGANCNACHYESAGTNGLSADHAPHLAAAVICASCHTVPATVAVHALDATGAADDGAALTDKAAALQDEATVTPAALGPNGTDPDAGNPTCNNMACHDPSETGGTYAATWITEASSCLLCHGDNTPGATRMASNTHTGHLTTSTLAQGGAIVCVNCHGALPVVDAHRNGTVALTGAASTYTGDVVLADGDAGDAGTCGVNACHNNGIDSSTGTPDTSPYTWNAPVGGVGTCTECHGNTSGTLASNAHDEHIAYAGALCTDCHSGSATAASHISGTVNLDAGKATYAGGDLDLVTPNTYGTCTTDSCHNRPIAGAEASALWSAANLLCDDCHYKNLAGNPTGAANAAHFDPLSTTHNRHFNAGKLCANCHGADPGAGDTVHISSKTSLTDGATATQDEANVTRAQILWTDGGPGVTDGNTCFDNGGGLALGCHATGSADWDIAIPADGCTTCHTDTATATVNPTSGLHAVTPTVSGNAHNGSWDADGGDGSVTANCVTCHTTSPSTSHANGTLNGAPGGGLCRVGLLHGRLAPELRPQRGRLHDLPRAGQRQRRRRELEAPLERDGREQRRAPSARTATACRRPTGTPRTTGPGTRATPRPPTTRTRTAATRATEMDEHSVCQYCHGCGAAAGYTTAWGGGAPGHGDGSITMNGPEPSTGAQYDDVTGGCLAGCHTAPSVNFALNTDSGWDANYGDYGAGNCEGCHNFDGPGPNVMGDGTDPIGTGDTWTPGPGGPKPYDDGTWGFNVNGHGANGGAANTPRASANVPYLFGDAACTGLPHGQPRDAPQRQPRVGRGRAERRDREPGAPERGLHLRQFLAGVQRAADLRQPVLAAVPPRGDPATATPRTRTRPPAWCASATRGAPSTGRPSSASRSTCTSPRTRRTRRRTRRATTTTRSASRATTRTGRPSSSPRRPRTA